MMLLHGYHDEGQKVEPECYYVDMKNEGVERKAKTEEELLRTLALTI